MTVTYLTETEHATLVALLEERRRVVRQRKRAKLEASRQLLALEEKVRLDRSFALRLEELNDQIDKLMKREGESE
ncbi:MAG: hypothetical protein U0800_12650 [Isosphaeraceae bacterium]